MNVIIKVMNIIKQKRYSAIIQYIIQVTKYRMVYYWLRIQVKRV